MTSERVNWVLDADIRDFFTSLDHGWLGSVVRGRCAYYAVPGNSDAIRAFRTQAARHWYRALRHRSQRTRLNWERMDRLATRWLSQARIRHPWPSVRFDARTRGGSPVR